MWPSVCCRCRSTTRVCQAPRSVSARSSPSRPLSACATGSCSRRSGTTWVSTPRWRSRPCGRLADPNDDLFQQLLFSKIVPNCKKLGLLDAGDGWLRDRFTEISVIQFEDWVDTGEEYADLDEVAKDRAASA